jgi:RING-variant domain
MASAPSQASRRRSSPTEEPSSTQASPSTSTRQSSSESDVVVINTSQAESTATPTPQPQTPGRDVRRCWVCMGDETDDPENNVWRSPCPCSLTAHETCLLEWIADKEAPPPGQIAHNHEIKCPQCQTPLKIQRPRDVLVTVADGVQRVARALILPTALFGIAGCFYSGFVSYGANAMALVLGPETADAILAPQTFDSIHNSAVVRRWLQIAADYPLTAFGQLFPFFPRMRSPTNIPYYLGLPLIGPSLVLWRTRWGDIGFSMLIPIVSSPPSSSNIC